MPVTITPTFPILDTTTQGNWLGTYGLQGYSAPGIGIVTYDFSTIVPLGELLYTWEEGTTDPRALLDANGTGRHAACWYSGVPFTVAIGLSDGKQYALSLYCIDWDNQGRSQRVDLLDTAGNLLGSQTLSNFTGGVYLGWQISGSVVVRLTKLAGPNAVLSGVFLDAGPYMYWVTNTAGQILLGCNDLHSLRGFIPTLPSGTYAILDGTAPCGTIVVTSPTKWVLTGPGGYYEGLG